MNTKIFEVLEYLCNEGKYSFIVLFPNTEQPRIYCITTFTPSQRNQIAPIEYSDFTGKNVTSIINDRTQNFDVNIFSTKLQDKPDVKYKISTNHEWELVRPI